jgi:hypothetical protein
MFVMTKRAHPVFLLICMFFRSVIRWEEFWMLSTYGRCEVFVKHFVISYARTFVQFIIDVMGVLDLCSFTVGCSLSVVGFISLKLVLTKLQNKQREKSIQCSNYVNVCTWWRPYKVEICCRSNNYKKWQSSTPTIYEQNKQLHRQDCSCKLNIFTRDKNEVNSAGDVKGNYRRLF